MLRIGLQFPAGRVHATPWGRHINEGVVDWPPSPWRMARALVATGFTKLGWTHVPELAGDLIVRLASTPPVYHLPPATCAHTRHFMPTQKGVSRILDAFVIPSRAGHLVVEWDVLVSDRELEVLDSLLSRMSYLGRAESWVEARRVREVPPGNRVCAPGEESPGLGWERVELLVMMPAEEYAAWRECTHAREAERRLEHKRQRARDLGRRRPRSLSTSLRARLEAELPARCMDALCAETANVQRAGWSQPPGTRWIPYWRPSEAVDGRARATRREPASEEPVARNLEQTAQDAHRTGPEPCQVAVLELIADRDEDLPLMRDALWRCDAVHKGLVSHSAALDPGGQPASCFTGRDAQHRPLHDHKHTTLMPLCLAAGYPERGQPRRIDHIALYTPMGLDHHALTILERMRVTYGRDLPPMGVSLTATGQPEEFSDRIPMVAAARVWQSHTPFVAPRYLKASGKNSLLGQVRAELACHGLPEPAAVEIEIGTTGGLQYLDSAAFWPLWKRRERGEGMRLAGRWRTYRRVRQGNAPKPPIDVALGLRLTFAEPVQGPISIGYACHFGLGLFVPISVLPAMESPCSENQ